MKTNQNQNSKFQIGEEVRVKTGDKVITSFHSTQNAIEGCLFTKQMWDYCGSTYKVVKIVNGIFNEHRQRTFKTKSPLYILEGLICNGSVEDFPQKCDHSCFLLWHEKWLEKVQ
jgi:hypothetical protein